MVKCYGYLPIIKEEELADLTDHQELHLKRKMEAVTELVAGLAQIQSEDIRAILSKYHACLVEYPDGSRTLGLDFPEKRFA